MKRSETSEEAQVNMHEMGHDSVTVSQRQLSATSEVEEGVTNEIAHESMAETHREQSANTDETGDNTYDDVVTDNMVL